MLPACSGVNAKELDGILKNVDTVNGTITLTTKDGKTVTINISANSTVDLYGISASLDALEPGSSIKASTANTGSTSLITVQPVVVTTPPPGSMKPATLEANGTVTSIGSGNITINSATTATSAGNVAITLTTGSDTIIYIGNTLGKLSDIKVGDRVQVKYERVAMKALQITVQPK